MLKRLLIVVVFIVIGFPFLLVSIVSVSVLNILCWIIKGKWLISEEVEDLITDVLFDD